MDPSLGPSSANAPCLSGEGSFPVWIHIANNKTNAETETAQTLFNGQTMHRQELGSQINFSLGGNQGKILKARLLRGRHMYRFSGKRQCFSWHWGATPFLPLYGPLASGFKAGQTIMAWMGRELTIIMR